MDHNDTLANIDMMDTGPGLDVLVAEWVMKLRVQYHTWRQWSNDTGWLDMRTPYIPEEGKHSMGDGSKLVPPYSTDIAAAWQVSKQLESLGYIWYMGTNTRDGAPRYLVAFQRPADPLPSSALAATDCLALCRAALKAVGYTLAGKE